MNTSTPSAATTSRERLVGSDRVLAVLVELAQHPEGIALDEMAHVLDSPKSTVHRAFASLRRAGLAAQIDRGRYVLGDEFLRMAFANHEARPDHARVQPFLERLAARFGETAHYAVLDGHDVVYRGKVDPPSGAIRLTSTVGGRNPAHSTGVGKALLAFELRDEAAVATWIGDRELERRTERTAVTPSALDAELTRIRERGYSIDDRENEPDVNCVAFPVFFSSPSRPSGAVSVSAIAHRTPLASLIGAVDEIRGLLAGLGHSAQ